MADLFKRDGGKGRDSLDLIPIRVGKISSNDSWPLLYIPKLAIEVLGLRKGRKVLILIDRANASLVIKPIEDLNAEKVMMNGSRGLSN
ncbi:MAG: hypothetical protein DRJ30_07170 [Candidatus Methanomethylicota archaeon]|nr:MAG: hypothetical protein DRJ30_07170 [Candidatus Verstraetearchaeota archaeon]